ncbi:MAG: tetratricopeptide repeat protein [Sedimentisphaerales bacterium]|nr:tetratricopeptide repeat protein [Sedimentisphaerales bacterium]
MRQQITVLLFLLMTVVGCNQSHQQAKQAAMERWQKARARLSVDLAIQQFHSGDLKKAAATAVSAIDINPQYTQAHLILGQIYLEQDKLSNSRNCFEKCLELEPDQPEAHYFLGVINQRLQKLQPAFDHFQAAWRFQADRADYLLGMVNTKMAMGEPDNALQLLNENINTVNKTETLYATAGNIYVSLGRDDAAVEKFQQALDINPDAWIVKESLAFSLQRCGQHNKALQYFKELDSHSSTGNTTGSGNTIDSGKNSDGRWIYQLAMGDCYLALKNYHQAQRCYEYASTQNASNPDLWVRLGQTHLARQKTDQAETCAHKALALDENNSEALLLIGYVAIKNGDYQQGKTVCKQMIDKNDQDPLAYCMLGQCLQALGQNDEALDCYARALKIDPNDKLAGKLLLTVQDISVGTKAGTSSH